jgi:hypothetical protein
MNSAIHIEGNTQVLTRLFNARMNAVTFILDYVRLHFEHITVDALTWPRVEGNDGSVVTQASPGYRDALCAFIGHHVVRAEAIPDQRLRIEFADGRCISISLTSEDNVHGGEMALYR